MKSDNRLNTYASLICSYVVIYSLHPIHCFTTLAPFYSGSSLMERGMHKLTQKRDSNFGVSPFSWELCSTANRKPSPINQETVYVCFHYLGSRILVQNLYENIRSIIKTLVVKVPNFKLLVSRQFEGETMPRME